MRRSALIGPWGVGAIVPFPNDEALMIAGLDAWRYQDEHSFVIVRNYVGLPILEKKTLTL